MTQSNERDPLLQAYEYYLINQDKLVKSYYGKVVAIVGEQIIGVFDDKVSADLEMRKTYDPGSFLLQSCVPSDQEQVHVYQGSRVAFT